MAGLLEIGRIGRPQGLRGAVVVALTTDRLERLDVGSVLLSATGELVVQSSRHDGQRWIVTFVGVTTREGAEDLTGSVLSAAPLELNDDTLWIHELIGARVVDQEGVDRGEVVSVLANPASDLLELDTGSLVPLRFVVGEPTAGSIVVDVPDGLWDL